MRVNITNYMRKNLLKNLQILVNFAENRKSAASKPNLIQRAESTSSEVIIFEFQTQRNLKFNFRILVVAFLILAASCSETKTKKPYIISDLPSLQNFEEEDNKKCNIIKLAFDNPDNYGNELYWRCRLSYARFRQQNSFGDNHFQNPSRTIRAQNNLHSDRYSKTQKQASGQEISSLIGKISAILYDHDNSSLQLELENIDQKDHRECFDLGFNSETDNKQKIDDYFLCRKRLIERNSDYAPFGKDEYLKFITRSYNLGYVVDKSVKSSLINEVKKKGDYPECSSFSVYSADFAECTKKHDKLFICESKIVARKADIESDGSNICQRQAYERFGNEMLKNGSGLREEIVRKNYISDYQNRLNFDGLGIDESTFSKTTSNQQKSSSLGVKSGGVQQNFDFQKPQSNQKYIQQKKSTLRNEFSNVDIEQQSRRSYAPPLKALVRQHILLKSKTEDDIFNSKNALYTRYELGLLRQKYIGSCQKLIASRMQQLEQMMHERCLIDSQFNDGNS